MRQFFIFLCLWGITGCLSGQPAAEEMMDQEDTVAAVYFSGGRYWFLQETFGEVYGVVDVVAGYTGGSTAHPVAGNFTQGGHREAVSVRYRTSRISFAELLDVYFQAIDPTDGEGQFLERGNSFQPAVFWTEEAQKLESAAYFKRMEQSGIYEKPIAVALEQAGTFYQAAENDQWLSITDPDLYQQLYAESGRERGHMEGEDRMGSQKKAYEKPDEKELKKELSALQYQVTQENGTERAFSNPYWNNHEEGLYVDIVSGEPLFSSKDKFDSGTGWPSFSIPLVPGNIVALTDKSYGMVRTEVRSRYGDSHLGHLFPDGPQPTGLRYCINSASLRFIPVKDLEKEGYGEYIKYFEM